MSVEIQPPHLGLLANNVRWRQRTAWQSTVRKEKTDRQVVVKEGHISLSMCINYLVEDGISRKKLTFENETKRLEIIKKHGDKQHV